MARESTSQAEPGQSGRRRRFPLTLSPTPEDPAPSPVAGSPAAAEQATSEVPGASLPRDTARLLRSLPTPAMWVDPHGVVLWWHPALEALRIVRRRGIGVGEIAAMVESARTSDQVIQRDMSVKRPGRRQPRLSLRVRVSPMEDGSAIVLVQDMTEAERLDHVRRDFVANVSHELKTPIGALSLLAEAVTEGRDDPEAVAHFASRMVAETRRLTTLVNDLMDLSRLEGIDPLHPMEPVSVDDVVSQACDDVRLLAREKGIRFLRGGVAGLKVLGVESQLVTAVRNLLVNAVNYSPASTKVAVATGQADGSVTIAVTDQGIGIPPGELDRIFERFYRVDQARSRDTGGTGLGLAIVKHVCANHSGHCDVWSRVGAGSTFTIRLPELGEGRKRGRTSPVKEET
ncbi:MAG: ATP-binding protein [Candidatus Nanopelagicales bacterium]|jgi:two-component system sensor histidine kinase SenX3|nr:ATP-binding protein [Candidatus Nanopelagicales bacterium]